MPEAVVPAPVPVKTEAPKPKEVTLVLDKVNPKMVAYRSVVVDNQTYIFPVSQPELSFTVSKDSKITLNNLDVNDGVMDSVELTYPSANKNAPYFV